MTGTTSRDLVAWQKSVDLISYIYDRSRRFPRDERFGLTVQMRRAAISIASNIAEGVGRRSHRDVRRFFLQARGSLYEVEAQVLVAERLLFISVDERVKLLELTSAVGKPLSGLIRNLDRILAVNARILRYQ